MQCRQAFRRSKAWIVIPLMVLIPLLFTPEIWGQGRGSRSRIARWNAARRQQEIEQLQSQLDQARKLLESVTVQGTLTQSQLESARQSVLVARQETQSIEKKDRVLQQRMHQIEEDILESQTDESEYAKALDALESARHELDAELHRALRRPPPDPQEDEATRLSELARLTAEEREILAGSTTYSKKKETLHESMERVSSIRKKLFEDNSDWKVARNEHHKVDQAKTSEERSLRGAANDALEARGELKTAAQIASSTQASIARIEARLHELGAKPKANPDEKSSNGKNTSK